MPAEASAAVPAAEGPAAAGGPAAPASSSAAEGIAKRVEDAEAGRLPLMRQEAIPAHLLAEIQNSESAAASIPCRVHT